MAHGPTGTGYGTAAWRRPPGPRRSDGIDAVFTRRHAKPVDRHRSPPAPTGPRPGPVRLGVPHRERPPSVPTGSGPVDSIQSAERRPARTRAVRIPAPVPPDHPDTPLYIEV